ncbi:MAG: DEAD/DEAH box helicase family protein [Candidatus Gracilibacteria bacterium]|nr:DEAD/DEAH box helicase family protein [Candidatus Gracilibacteria bacterium]
MFTTVIPIDRSFDDVGLTYLVPDFLSEQVFLGALVEIPFGKQIIKAVIVDIFDNFNDETISLKPIVSVVYDFPIIKDYQIELIKWMATYYFSLVHQVLGIFLPRNLLEKIEKKKFEFKETKILNYNKNITKSLTENQKEAYQTIKETAKKNILLFGITGSGKTEIYINLIKDSIEAGKQVLLLVPEIILTSQVATNIREVFGENVAILNSSISRAKKTDIWQKIYTGNIKVVVGTRSSLFYPYKDLGLIIVDEEHDNSYISDSAPRYDAVEVATKLAGLLDIKLILASGTPAVKHMYKAIKEKYEIVNLFEEIK